MLRKTRSWGWGTVLDLVPFCWGGVDEHVEEGELRAKPEPKRPRIEGETQIEGAARDCAGVEVCGGAGWALPRKFFLMHTWNHAFWCIVEAKIYIFPSDQGFFRRRAKTRFRSYISTFKTNKFWQEPRKFNRMRHRTHRLKIENRKCLINVAIRIFITIGEICK